MDNSEKPVRSKDRFLVFGAPVIGEAEIDELVATMRSGWLGTGPKVARFEQDIMRFTGSPHAMAVNSCTGALHLSILAAGIGPGDEVITTPMTFCATVNAIIHAGATPVLADVEPHTLNIDPEQIERRITGRTKAILPVHFAGRPCNMDALLQISGKHGLLIIEDCAHAIEAEYHGRKTGTIGDLGCYSFYVTKNIVTGEGGMVVSSNASFAERIKVLALHGMSKDAWQRFGDDGFKHYQVVEAGFKYNMMDLQAAIGIHQLANIEAYWRRRKEIWEHYGRGLEDTPLTLPAAPEPDTRHSHHLYTVQVDEDSCGITRDRFLDGMTENGIGVGVHYMSIPEHPYYRKTFNWDPDDYPVAKRIGRQTVSLPISAKLKKDDVEDVLTAVRRLLRNADD